MAMDVDTGRVCVPGGQKACACNGGGQGTQVCNAGGTGYLGCGPCAQGGSDAGSLCTAPGPSRAQVTSDVLADFEGATPGVIKSVTPGGSWSSYRDYEVATLFTPDPSAWMVEAPGHGGTGSAVHVAGSGFVGPASATSWGGGTGFYLGGPTPGGRTAVTAVTAMAADVSAYTGISFYAKSSIASDLSVQFPTADTLPDYCTCAASGNCYATHSRLISALAADWTKYTIKFVDLIQPTYVMSPVPFDRTSLVAIDFASNGPVSTFDFWIDDITLIH